MNDFSGYEKMPNSLKKMGLSESDFSKLEKLKWVVTEKVHGANFSFIYENGVLKFAKRKDYLRWKDDFFGFQLVVNQLESKIIKLFEDLSAQINAPKYILYGELFGGEYPHPEVKANKNVQAIQTGVYYAPSIEFCAFDIAIQNKNSESKYYLDYETAIKYFENSNLIYAKPLFVGKFGNAMNFDIKINSQIPKELKLPELAQNLIEGVVIKPYNQQKNSELNIRPIIKLKNPEFEEEKKFHKAEKWTYLPNVESNSENLSFLVEELRNYVSYNRLESAISKTGTLDYTKPNRILDIKNELFNDVFTDFNENNNNLLEDLSREQHNWVADRINADINKLITKAIDKKS